MKSQIEKLTLNPKKSLNIIYIINNKILKAANFNIISGMRLCSFSIKYFTIPYTPKNRVYRMDIFIGTKKKLNILTAR